MSINKLEGMKTELMKEFWRECESEIEIEGGRKRIRNTFNSTGESDNGTLPVVAFWFPEGPRDYQDLG